MINLKVLSTAAAMALRVADGRAEPSARPGARTAGGGGGGGGGCQAAAVAAQLSAAAVALEAVAVVPLHRRWWRL